MTEEQFYLLWEKFAHSKVAESLPDDIPAECVRIGITIDYFLHEFV
jgi:hypothetical protein